MSKQPSAITVMVVEDDELVRRMFAEALRRHGFQVIERSDARELVHVVRAQRPVAIVMDLSLPGPSGVEACQRIKGDGELAQTIVLMVSGHSSFEALRRATDAGASRFLVKPLSGPKLASAVRLEINRLAVQPRVSSDARIGR